MIQVAKKLSVLLFSAVWITQASWAQTTLSFDSETSGTVEPFDPLFDLPPLPKSRPFGLVPVFNNEGETVNPYGAGLFPGASGSLFAGIVEGVTLYEEESAVLPTSLATLQANDINLDAALGGDEVIVIGGDSPGTSDPEDGMSDAEREKLKRQKVLINKALIKRDPAATDGNRGTKGAGQGDNTDYGDGSSKECYYQIWQFGDHQPSLFRKPTNRNARKCCLLTNSRSTEPERSVESL